MQFDSRFTNYHEISQHLLRTSPLTQNDLDDLFKRIDKIVHKVLFSRLSGLKLLLVTGANSDCITDYLYDNDMDFLCDELGLGIPCMVNIGTKKRKSRSDSDETFVGQSGETVIEQANGDEAVENVVMHNDQEVTLLSLSPKIDDYTYNPNVHDDDTITNWLSRPRVISTIHCTVGTEVWNQSHPYTAFFTTALPTPLQNKMDNYFLFRGKLRLQFKINGSPFHYGRYYACFAPGLNDVSYPQNNPSTSVGTLFNYDAGTTIYNLPMKTLYTQRPGVFLDPTTNQPQELILPFCLPNNYIDLRYSGQFDYLGTLTIFSINKLQHSNGGTDPIDIKVFASIIDPVLTTPMSQTIFTGEAEMKRVNQKKMKESPAPANKQNNQRGDEYGNGIISAPATALASFAGTLGDVPVIGKFAMATKLAANAASDIAKLWGFSRPISLSPSMYMRPKPFGKMAVIDGEDSVPTLAVDSKQEVSVDPATVGLDSTDQMAIAYVAQREALLTQFNWDSTQLSGVKLCSIKVHPGVFPYTTVTNGTDTINAYFHTPVGWVSNPFTYWRGSLVYRIQIVASQMHRGRLLVQWDPSIDSYADLPNTSTRYSQVLDLAECRDMSFCVCYNQAEPFKELGLDYNDPAMVVTDGGSNPSGSATNNCKMNGILHFFVFNQLGAPITTSTITVNVFVRAGDDYMVRSPNGDIIENLSYHEPIEFTGEAMMKSSTQDNSADYVACEENHPYQREIVIINGSGEMLNDTSDMNKVFYGEQYVSIRTLLKRYTLCSTGVMVSSSATAHIDALRIQLPYIPSGPGSSYGNSNPFGQGVYNSVTIPYNFLCFSWLRYFMQPYALYRGAVKLKVQILGNDGSHGMSSIQVCRAPWRSIDDEFFDKVDLGTPTTTGIFAFNIADNVQIDFGDSTAGIDISDFNMNGRVVEYQVPWQDPTRFYFNNIKAPGSEVISTAGLNPTGRNGSCVLVYGDAGVNNNAFVAYQAVGDDFSLFYFVNAPLMYDSMRHKVTPA